MFTAEEVFDLAVQIEENGEAYYRDAVEVVADPSIRRLLTWLADEEARHRRCFLDLKSAARSGAENDWAERISGAFLQSSINDHAFSLDEVDFSRIENVAELLRVAVGFEEDSIMFYEILQSFVTDSPAGKHVSEILKEEKRHIEMIEEKIEEIRGPFLSKK